MKTIIAEFLEAYVSIFKANLTQKFRNMIHYARSVKMLGQLFYN